MDQHDPADLPLERLLRCAAGGDREAWRRLVDIYSGRLFGFLLKQCRDRELAEELTQATFVKLVTEISGGYEERGRFEPWLFRIAMNKLRDEMRRRRRQAVPMDMSPGAAGGRDEAAGWAAAQQSVVTGGPAAAPQPHERVIRDEQVARLRLAIESMNEADREVLHLRHTAGLSFAEIAETLEQPLGTVLARGHRALGKLRKMLAEPDRESA